MSRLRALPRDQALGELRQLPGIGPFSAELVLLRGAGDPDGFPAHERRLHRALARLYHLEDPGPDGLQTVAERWRPYRTWAAVLVRVWAEERTPQGAGRPPAGRHAVR